MSDPCSWCHATGFVGVVPCRECGSTGRARCEECLGTGKVRLAWEHESMGEVDCLACRPIDNDDRLSRECREWADRDLALPDERERALDGMANTLAWFGVDRKDCTVRCVGAPVSDDVAWPREPDHYDGRVYVRYQVDAFPAETRRFRVTLPK